jgi:hypothetical protein
MGNALGLYSKTNGEMETHHYLIEEIARFDNLSIQEIEIFWRSFYDHAQGFALSKEEFVTICISAACYLEWPPGHVAEQASCLFDVFTKDSEVKLLDALEFLSSIVFICIAPLNEKIELVFDSWDMSEDGIDAPTPIYNALTIYFHRRIGY